MNSTNVQKIRDVIAQNEQVGIAVGKNPNLDQMAGALSLYLSLTSFGKKVNIVCPTPPIVEISSLVGIDKVKTRFDSAGGDLVVSFPYREGEIEKVSYTLDDGFLNIVVKERKNGLSFDEKDIKYKKGGSSNQKLLLIVGTQRLSDLEGLFDPAALKDTTIVNIDVKSDNQGFGDIVAVSPHLSSVSEHVADLLLKLNLSIDTDIAQNLLSGIAFATDNFQKKNSSFLSFEMAGMLMRKGAIRGGRQEKIEKSTFSFPEEPEYSDADNKTGKTPPSDWLMPKVFKGSTNI